MIFTVYHIKECKFPTRATKTVLELVKIFCNTDTILCSYQKITVVLAVFACLEQVYKKGGLYYYGPHFIVLFIWGMGI